MMKEMVKLALESYDVWAKENEDLEASQMPAAAPATNATLTQYHRNDELDLHKLYSPKERSWFNLQMFHWCCKA